jgi:glycosyltransferase involved in cell wall biosynthesis
MRAYRPEIVHMHFFSLLSPFIPYLRWRHGVKIVVHVRSLISYNIGRTWIATLLIPLRKYIAAKSIHRVLFVSEFACRKTLSEFPFKRDQMITIYNAVEASVLVSSDRTQIRSTLAIPEEAYIVFSAAWLRNGKGIHVLIESISKVIKVWHENVVLVIGEDGPERSKLEELAKSLGVDQSIFFLGWCDMD